MCGLVSDGGRSIHEGDEMKGRGWISSNFNHLQTATGCEKESCMWHVEGGAVCSVHALSKYRRNGVYRLISSYALPKSRCSGVTAY